MNVTEIVDLSGVSPQQTFLDSRPEKPLATSTLYINRFTTTNADKSQDHTIVGMHVVLKKGNANGLWEALHVDRSQQKLDANDPRVATRSLQIYCDTLEVHGEFSAPEADVTIFCRRLVWASGDAAINTSPLAWAVGKAQNASGAQSGKNGAAGRNAGSFQVFVSKVEPTGDTRPRLKALGGQGQHPGAGKDGEAGKSMSSWSSQPFIVVDSKIVTSKANVNFSPPAVYIDYEWRWGFKWGSTQLVSDKQGADSFPENGTNALAPGIPGDGGNGGGLTTNLTAVAQTLKNDAGKAGNKERDYWGGAAGTPTSCAKYKLKLWHDLTGTDHADYDLDKYETHTTSKGTDARAQGPKKGDGSKPQPNVISEANAWVHPLSLQKTLEYARDLFLAGGQDELEKLLVAYEEALRESMPTKNKAWSDDSEAQWAATQSEVAAMLQRLRGHLDYFGNAAGYTPLLSLAGTIKLYEEETRLALRTILVAGWIDAKERDAKEAAAVLGDTISTLNDDTVKDTAQVVNSENKINEVTKRINDLQQELNNRSRELAELRTKLLGKAVNDLQQQARIKFAIKMAAAVCQVIPVGQPALGTIGSLASVSADFIGGSDEKAPDTVSKLGEVMNKAKEAAAKAKEAKEKAAKEKKDDEAKDAKGAKDKASAWAKAGKGLGPALSQVSGAMKALQVPESEVEAQLQRLESESEEWKEQVKKIRELNERKAAFASDLIDALQSLGEGYARISSNAAAVLTMHQERGKQVGKIDPAATAFVRQMGQRSRLTLLKYLYLMVKAYETTVFKPIDVDWKLAEVTDKINELLKPEGGFNAASLNDHVKILEPIYRENVNTVRKQLLTDFSFREDTLPLQLGLSSQQTPELLADLNRSGQIVIDPIAYGLVLSDYELSRLSNIELIELKFDPNGPQLPETVNIIVKVQPAHTGTMRKGESLYSVYSDQPLNWKWTYISGKPRTKTPSQASQDLLDLILGKDAGQIRQKVALPPMWSDLTISVAYSQELPLERRPRISRLFFEFSCDISPAPAHQRVLKVRSMGSTGGAVIECSPDLGGRGNGFEHMIRIYSKDANVRLNVPSHVGRAAFAAWDVVGTQTNQVGVKEKEVNVKLNTNLLAQCHWNRSNIQEPKPVVAHVVISEEAKLAVKHAAGDGINEAMESVLAVARDEMIDPSESQTQARDLLMRVKASNEAAVLGVAPTMADAELVEEGKDGWKLVNYRGIVGWVSE
jgi:hypothetical protein